jgi:hypothetical protein
MPCKDINPCLPQPASIKKKVSVKLLAQAFFIASLRGIVVNFFPGFFFKKL